ncbi:TPM domain-containing protein [Ferruginibacter albus]|uniref:TPM domain-containing protein n=1 Tax=Ferruginibacter albus TaxID=2875540 RepID=UPI001CC6EB4B|nr:TPM domain-containing protein [Ferruginibacter albus]UAY52707.1 TPM domain-containing protein [Ferruginibacter albus]
MKKLFSIFILLLIGIGVFAQSGFNPNDLLKGPPSQQKLVNDYSNVLTADQKQSLENKLDAFDDSTSTQVAVVIIPSLGDYDVSDYGVKLLRAWGIGNKEHNNGVLLLINTEQGNHRINITTGYGVEGALPDITCKQIIDEIITPNFKGGDYYEGLEEGTDAILKATKGEYQAPENYRKEKGSPFGFIIIIIIILVLIGIGSNGGGGGFLPFIIGNMIGSSGRGWDSGGSSGWSGGGGFGGFGGGSSGGGGASGSW